MARGATRSNDQAFSQQSLAVDAFREIFKDMILMNDALLGYGCSFLMTLSAQEWNFEWCDRGTRILHRYNIMRAVTLLAVRGQGITPRYGLAMKGLCMKFLFRRVTCSAVNARKILIVRELFPDEIGMTVSATQRRVDGCCELALIHKDGNGFAFSLSGLGFVPVAGKAVTVLLSERRLYNEG
jgi:hypothetical protein